MKDIWTFLLGIILGTMIGLGAFSMTRAGAAELTEVPLIEEPNCAYGGPAGVVNKMRAKNWHVQAYIGKDAKAIIAWLEKDIPNKKILSIFGHSTNSVLVIASMANYPNYKRILLFNKSRCYSNWIDQTTRRYIAMMREITGNGD